MVSITREDVVRCLGSISDHTAAEILQIEPVLEDIEDVAMRLAQEDDVMGEARKPLSGVAARIYEIVMQDPLYAGNEREERRGAT